MSGNNKINKRTFSVKTEGEPELKLEVKRPDQKAQMAAQRAHNRAFKEALESGAIFRPAIERHMREQGLWDDQKQAEENAFREKLRKGELKLSLGGGKLSELRQTCFDMQDARAGLQRLMAERNRIDVYTAEAQAEDAKFSCLVALCTRFADDGKPFFKDVEDYLSRRDEKAAEMAAGEFAKLEYGVDDDWFVKLPENKFLIKHGLADEKGRLVNREGKLVDRQGRPVNEEGYLVDGQNRPVDPDGVPVKPDGTYDVTFSPFEDDLLKQPAV